MEAMTKIQCITCFSRGCRGGLKDILYMETFEEIVRTYKETCALSSVRVGKFFSEAVFLRRVFKKYVMVSKVYQFKD